MCGKKHRTGAQIPVFDNISFTKKMILNTFVEMIRSRQKKYTNNCIPVVILFLLIFIIPAMASAQDMSLFSFGKGKIQVRLYADYFCGPCRDLEPKIEYLMSDLVKRGIITITFIDAPFHKYSSLYAKYFLYILSEQKEINHALKARATLFEASKIPLADEDKLEAFLHKKGVKFKIFDTKPVFAILQNYIREDQLNATPTCIIINGTKKEAFYNAEVIVKALEKLK
jgi:thiol-disulfide isomerase/thioredoxin